MYIPDCSRMTLWLFPHAIYLLCRPRQRNLLLDWVPTARERERERRQREREKESKREGERGQAEGGREGGRGRGKGREREREEELVQQWQLSIVAHQSAVLPWPSCPCLL